MKAPTTIREVRLWHWRKVLAFRKVGDDFIEKAKILERKFGFTKRSYYRSKANQNYGKADWHLSAVHALNAAFPEGDTAEQDDKVMK